jgi:hypothetical protein
MRTILRPIVAAMIVVALASAPTFAQRIAPPNYSNELPSSPSSPNQSGESNGW